MGDRGGGREVKGASLKKSKKNPGSTAAKAKKAPKASPGPSSSASAPPPLGDEPYFDCAAAIVSRQFDRDRDRVLQRAKSEGCCAVVQWFSDIEKQQQLAELSKANSGFLYFVVGVHPDNVDRTNKKSHEGWLEKVEEFGKKAECVGVLTGLNLVRETGTHFAQEQLLTSACKLADKLQLPLVLHVAPDGTSLVRALELLRAEGWGTEVDDVEDQEQELGGGEFDPSSAHRVMVHDVVSACAGDSAKLKLAVHAGCMCMVSAAGLADGSEAVQAQTREALQHVPLSQLLIGSDSPWHTPQNLEDQYLRTLRNEPGNIAAIVQALCEVYTDSTREQITTTLKANAIQFFGMEALTPEQLALAEAAATASAAAAATAAAASASVSSASAPAAKEKQATKDAAGPAEPSTSSASSSYYSCQRCRKKLFTAQDVSVHGLDASRATVFKTGEEGLCSAFVFVKATGDHKELLARTGLEVHRDNVECSECCAKLGRFAVGEMVCSCGASVAGPTVRLGADKLDFFDATIDAETLAARARLEAEESQRLRSLEADTEQPANQGSKKKKKAKMKSENRGNFSSFRNKSFVPNASRVEMTGKGGIRLDALQSEEGADQGEGDDEEEDGDDEEEEEEEEEIKATKAPKATTKAGK